MTSLPVMALEEVNSASNLEVGSVLGSLVLVLACIFLFSFLIKKSNLIRYGRHSNPIKLIATQPLTNKSRVQIIEVHGKQYLLGVSEQSVNLLEQLEVAVKVDANDMQGAVPFTDILANVLPNSGKKNE